MIRPPPLSTCRKKAAAPGRDDRRLLKLTADGRPHDWMAASLERAVAAVGRRLARHARSSARGLKGGYVTALSPLQGFRQTNPGIARATADDILVVGLGSGAHSAKLLAGTRPAALRLQPTPLVR
jgi:hypothetical protein